MHESVVRVDWLAVIKKPLFSWWSGGLKLGIALVYCVKLTVHNILPQFSMNQRGKHSKFMFVS